MPKNYHYLALFFSFLINIATAQDWKVNIPDSNFEQALIDLGIDSDGVINQSIWYSEAMSVSSLNVSSRNITDLTGIKSFQNLISLNCSNNNITDFSGRNFPYHNVRTIDISGNLISTLTIASGEGLSKLEAINVSNNPNLTYLEVRSFSRYTTLNASQNPALKTVTCQGSLLRGINISDCPALEELDLQNNELGGIDLSTNFSLKNVNLSNNRISNLEIHNTQLNSLNVSENPLLSLDCSNNKLNTIRLSGNERDLNLSKNNLTSVNIRNTTSLTTLNISDNPLISLTFEDVKSLTNLDISHIGELKSLNLITTSLSNLDISTNVNLEELRLYDNIALTNLDFSQNSALKYLHVFNSDISSLDISSNNSLIELAISDTPLSYLDVSLNPNLTDLYLPDNQLTYLDVRNGSNSLINDFNAGNNPDLSCIFVDNAIAANAGEMFYSNWRKDEGVEYRSESCDFDIQITTDKTAITENGEVATITATLNQVLPNNDVTVYLAVSGTAQTSNYQLSSSTIVIPAGQLSSSVTLTAVEDDMDSDKTVIIDVESVENAEELTAQKLTITVVHINNIPTDIILSNLTIDENSIIGSEIGVFTSTDVDREDTYTYTLVSGDGDNDNSSFTIEGNQLFSGELFDFETKNSYSIRVQTDDGNGGTFSKSFVVSVNDLNFLMIENSSASLRFINDINLKLENSELIKGFQFDITFPDGFVFDPLNIKNTGLPENYQISCTNVLGNTFRVLGYSLTNESIASGTTSIITFPTFIDEGTPIGEYPIPVFDVILSDVDNVNIANLSPIDGIVTVYAHPRGDANGDNAINVLDILSVIDYIFGNPPPVFNMELVDINSDGTINILDILGIQDIILNQTAKILENDTKLKTSKSFAGANYLMVNNDSFSTNTFETIEINLENEDVVRGLEFNFVLPEGFTLNPAEITGKTRLDGLTISASEVSANTYKVLVFAFPPSTSTIAAGSGVAFNVPVFIEPDMSSGVYPITFTSVVISDENLNEISTVPPSVGEITINSTLGIDNLENFENAIKIYPNPTTNILNIDSEVNCSYQIFDLNGRRVGKGTVLLGKNEVDISLLQSGLYLLKISEKKGVVIKKIMKK